MESVTTIDGRHASLDVRFRELIRQSGRGGGSNPTSVSLLLVAARGQGATVGAVRRHECRHDEADGDCGDAVTVVD